MKKPERFAMLRPAHPGAFATIATLLLVVAASPVSVAVAQYFGTTPLDRQFEQSEFFFRSNHLNPFGFEGFARIAPGFMDDPLLALQLNPALAADSVRRWHAYADIRRSEVNRAAYGSCCYRAVDELAFDIWPGPVPGFAPGRDEAEPMAAVAAIGRPLAALPGLAVGATYQLVFRDEPFYSLDESIYYPVLYADAARIQEASIIDRSGGVDQARTSGHFAGAFASIDLVAGFTAGARFGYSRLDRTARLGSFFNDQFVARPNVSHWSNSDGRDQKYDHYEGEVGVTWTAEKGTTLGLSAGHLSGDVVQRLDRSHASEYRYGNAAGTDFNLGVSEGLTDQRIERDGGSSWAGAQVFAPVGIGRTLRIVYRNGWASRDIRLASAVEDTSYSEWSSLWNDSQLATGSSNHFVRDQRMGGGDETAKDQRAAAFVSWQFDDRTTLRLGVDVRHNRSDTFTSERVEAAYENNYEYTYPDQSSGYDLSGVESKTVMWTRHRRITSASVPVYLTTRLSKAIDLHAGFNRRFVALRNEEMTVVDYTLRSTTENGVQTIEEAFVERFFAPDVRRSDVRTTIIGGFAVRPSPGVEVRLLAAPEYRSVLGNRDLLFRWWMSFTIMS